MSGYENKTMEQLFKSFAFENGRINQADRERTQSLIIQEINRRCVRALDALRDCNSDEDADRLYRNFTGGRI